MDVLDFEQFHRVRVPELVARHGPLAVRAADVTGSLAFSLPDGRAWTYEIGEDGLTVRPGDDDADTVAALAEPDWRDFVDETRSCFGLVYAGRVSFPRGGIDELDRWEAVLRGLFDGRPPYDPAQVADLDLRRTFLLDDAGAAADFLQQAGFVHLRAVFDPDEIGRLGEEVERRRHEARPTDGRTWWAKDSTGADVCCRLIYASQTSALLADVIDDERFTRMAALCGAPVRPVPDRLDGVSVVLKSPDIVEGLADLPWHRDCGLGGHPVMCPTVLLGVQLDAANAATGQLSYLAGSHRTTGSPPGPDDTTLPIVPIDAEPGDVTIHFGHVLHVAPPPGSPGAGRRTMYVTYSNPAILDVVPEGRGYNDVLFTGLDDGHVQDPGSRLVAGG